MIITECIKDYQNFLAFLFSFVVFLYLFNFWWSVVILLTIEIFDYTLNIKEDSQEVADSEALIARKIKTANRRTASRQYKGFVTRSEFQEEEEEGFLSENKNRGYMFEERMFSGTNQTKKTQRKSVTLNEKSNSTFMTLLERKFQPQKENVRPSNQQPIVAVAKNNVSLRNARTSFDSYPKSPLYNNYRTALTRSPQIYNSPSSSIFDTSKNFVLETSVVNKIKRYQNEERFVQSCVQAEEEENVKNKSISEGLEVHGSYFINKSLISSDIGDEECSQIKSTIIERNKGINMKTINGGSSEQRCSVTESIFDTTSTEAVMSILKEKSKRKRSRAVQSPASTDYSKRIKFNDDESLPNELFPGVSPYKKEIIKKKRMISTGTQCENSDDETAASVKKVRKTTTTTSPSSSKFGLTEEQTDSMLDEKSVLSDTSADKQSMKAVPSNRNSLDKSYLNGSFLSPKDVNKESFESPPEGFASFTKLSEKPIDSLNSSKVHKNLLKSLHSIKSPFKRIIPSTFTPGSASKLRKHPIYFTAKIDIDEIQKNREEFGSKGVSFKAFRYEQEKAAKRVNDIFDDADDTDSSKVKVPGDSNKNLGLSTTTSQPSTLLAGFGTPVTSSAPLNTQTLTSSTIPAIKVTPSSLSSVTFGTSRSFSAVSTAITSTVQSHKSSLTVPFSLPPGGSGFKLTQSATTNVTSISTSLGLGSMVPSISANAESGSGKHQAPVNVSSSGFSFGIPRSVDNKPASSAISQTPSLATSFAVTTSSNQLKPDGAVNFTNITSIAAATSIPAVGQPSTGGFSFGVKSSQHPVPAGAGFLNSNALIKPQVSSVAPPLVLSIKSSQSVSFGGTSGQNATVSNNLQAAKAQFSFGQTNSNAPSLNSITPTFTFGSAVSTTTQQISATSGQPTQNINTQNIFGQPASSAVPTSTLPLFGVKPTQPAVTAVPFGVPSTQSVFTAQSSGTTSGASTFGQPPASTGFPFGRSTATSSAQAPGFNFTQISQPSIFGNDSNKNPFSVNTTKSSVLATTTTSSIFGTQSLNTTPMFGAPAATTTASAFAMPATTSTSIFAAPPAASASIFGAPPTTSASVFGMHPASSASIFGAPQTATSASIFGTQSATSGSIFGVPQTTTTSVFGAPATTASAFGTPSASAASIFGTPTVSTANIFGTPTVTTASVFGAAAPVTTASIFGVPAPQATSASVFGAPISTPSIFGSAPASSAMPTPFGSAASNSIFGTSNANAATNPFTNQPQQPSAGFDFSASMKQGPTFNFGGQGSVPNFGAQPPKPSFNFNSQPSTPTVGIGGAPNFGTPTFGGTPQASPFATPNFNAPAAGGFSMGTGGGQQITRQTSRARRRLKR